MLWAMENDTFTREVTGDDPARRDLPLIVRRGAAVMVLLLLMTMTMER